MINIYVEKLLQASRLHRTLLIKSVDLMWKTREKIFTNTAGDVLTSAQLHLISHFFFTGQVPKEYISDKTMKPTHSNGGGLLANLCHCWKCCLVPWLWMQLWKCYFPKVTQPAENNTLNFQECLWWCFCPTGETNYKMAPLHYENHLHLSGLRAPRSHLSLMKTQILYHSPPALPSLYQIQKVFWSQTEWRS